MGFIKEFKEFATGGNLIDFAVGVVLGGAFTKLTGAFVDGIIMPAIGLLAGGRSIADLKFILQKAEKARFDQSGNLIQAEVTEVAIRYGEFLSTAIDFAIVAFAMFLIVKASNRMRKQKETAPSEPSSQEQLLTEIRDLLKKP
ncbi:MAG: large-conductance mechanosensitive channel protein MscL [Bacteroidota bacterium]